MKTYITFSIAILVIIFEAIALVSYTKDNLTLMGISSICILLFGAIWYYLASKWK